MKVFVHLADVPSDAIELQHVVDAYCKHSISLQTILCFKPFPSFKSINLPDPCCVSDFVTTLSGNHTMPFKLSNVHHFNPKHS